MSNDYPKGIWDATEYFGHLAATNRLAKAKGFAFCRVSGLDGFEEALAHMQRTTAFICVSDIANGYTWALVQYDGKAGYVRSDCYAFSDAQGNLISTHTGQPAEVSREQVASSDPGTPAATLAEEYGRISGLLSSAGGSFNASVPNELVILLNNERGREGLPALTFNGNSPAYQLALCRAAMMALTSSGESNLPGYGKLSSMCAKYGVSSGSPSENMLITSASSAEAIHAALQSSSGSSARMSSAYTEIAVAIAQRGGNFFIVEVFIR